MVLSLLDPVSYTHLDVYKRQASRSRVIRVRRVRCRSRIARNIDTVRPRKSCSGNYSRSQISGIREIRTVLAVKQVGIKPRSRSVVARVPDFVPRRPPGEMCIRDRLYNYHYASVEKRYWRTRSPNSSWGWR